MSRAIIFGIAASVISISCASGPCHQLRQPELAAQQDRKSSGKSDSGLTEVPIPTVPAPTKDVIESAAGKPVVSKGTSITPKETTVLVYKADGSLQCGAAKGLSAEEMGKQLGPIKIFSREKKPDGLMHIQVCGSPTGMINVYEISASDLTAAEKLGFKRFDPR